MKVAIIGAGWAGMAAAVEATLTGHHAIVFEAARAIGGRARAVNGTLSDGTEVTLDNGQHILIGAYTESLRLMRLVGVNPGQALLHQPMALVFPDGLGIRFPDWPTPLDALGGIARSRGWTLADKGSLLRVALGWQVRGFRCQADTSVAQLCHRLSPRVMAERQLHRVDPDQRPGPARQRPGVSAGHARRAVWRAGWLPAAAAQGGFVGTVPRRGRALAEQARRAIAPWHARHGPGPSGFAVANSG